MSATRLLIVLALALSAPVDALASPPPSPRRISALLIPMDTGVEATGVKLEGYMNEALQPFSGFMVRKPEELFGLPPDEEARASLRRGEKAFQESLAAFEAKQYLPAEHKLRITLQELGTAVAAMSSCTLLCEALALHAAMLHQRGDVEEAKHALIDLIALNPTFELNPKRFTRELIALRALVTTSHGAALRGSATVKSLPAGARVYVDGELQGHTPLTLNTLSVGKHLLRLERPGFRQYGQFLEVTPDDVEVSIKLSPTPAYRAYDTQSDTLAHELSRSEPSQAAVALGKALGLDRGLVGTVKALGDSGTEVFLGFFDLSSGKRLASRRVVLQGDEYGQLQAEMSRLVNHLVHTALGDREKQVRSSDPLDSRHGTEDWSAENPGGKRRKAAKNPQGKDPLNGMSGTEDW